jgi:hypothetical protein
MLPVGGRDSPNHNIGRYSTQTKLIADAFICNTNFLKVNGRTLYSGTISSKAAHDLTESI